MDIVKYGVYSSERFSKDYKTDSDYVRLSEEKFFELIESYVGLEATFSVADWFGSTTTTKFTITGVEITEYKAVITVTSDRDCPTRFFPTLYQICKQNNILGPLSSSIIY